MKCQCSDPGCPVHRGKSKCDNTAAVILHRVDMTDRTGTPMCDGCAEDALDSGVFREGKRLRNPSPLGDRSKLHGAFKSAAQAQRKAASIPGASVVARGIAGQQRYVVMSYGTRAQVQRARYAKRSAMNPKDSGQYKEYPGKPARATRKAMSQINNLKRQGWTFEKTVVYPSGLVNHILIHEGKTAILNGDGSIKMLYPVGTSVYDELKGKIVKQDYGSEPNPKRKPNPSGDTVIYSRAISIVAAKGRGHRCDSDCVAARHTYKHNFGPGVRIIGLKNGDVLLSKR